MFKGIARLAPSSLVLLFVCTASPLQAQTLQPVQPEDYGQWESLGVGTLSQNGLWLAATVSRVNGEDELRIHQVSSDSVVVVSYGSGAVFSEDGRWVAYAIAKSDEEVERLRERDEDVRNDLGILDLSIGVQRTFSDVRSFAWGAEGSHLVLARYPADGTSVVVVQDMATDARVSLADVASWAWQGEGSLLAFTVHGPEGVGNGIQLYDASTGRVRSLDSGTSEYAQLTWREDSADLAVLRKVEDDVHDEPGHTTTTVTSFGRD